MRDISQSPIGIFDSGVGGLTVAKEISRQLPGEDFIYLGDTGRYPYGPRSAESVRRFALQNARFLMGFGIKVLVVACNTASSFAMDMLRTWIHVPIMGVIEPGARAAAKMTKNNKIGVVGTIGTINSGAYQRAIASENGKIEVFGKACPLFVPLAEEGITHGKIAEAVVHEYLDEFVELGVDTLVLGCTHYPLLKGAIARVLGDGIGIVDSANATVAELRRYLDAEKILRGGTRGAARFFVTDAPEKFAQIGASFMDGKIIEAKHVDLDI